MMHGQQNIKKKACSLLIVVDADVAVNNIKVSATELQQWVPSILLPR
jgi:hypothetical protein